MAIDAVIDNLSDEGVNLRLYLRPRTEPDMTESIAGQSEMVILDYTWKPEIGQEIWGGSGLCIIEPLWGQGDQHLYDRIGYTQLRERKKVHTHRVIGVAE
jgi:hypothetical protein